MLLDNVIINVPFKSIEGHRHEYVFWTEARCPQCNYLNGSIYKPSFLKNNNKSFCCYKCATRWDMQLDDLDKVRRLLTLADKHDALIQEAWQLELILYNKKELPDENSCIDSPLTNEKIYTMAIENSFKELVSELVLLNAEMQNDSLGSLIRKAYLFINNNRNLDYHTLKHSL